MSQELGSIARQQVSARTVRQRLQKPGFSAQRPWLPLHPLTLHHKQERLQWGDKRRLWYTNDSNNLLPQEQYGFRRGHSTEDQILYFCQCVRDAQNLKPINHTIAAFLDLSKAFDTVWRNKLILKMFDVFGVKGKALSWISDFLKYRVIRVKYNKTLSKDFKLSQGAPQGSVLSSTLFSMFLTGVEKLITANCSIGLFADDIVLWHSSHDIPSIKANLSQCLSRINDFATNHKLSFNLMKSVTTKIYTDGSKGETNTNGSGVLIELPGRVIKFQRRNADHASVFRTELIAILCGLSFINNIIDLTFSEIWILTDSRSSTEHLSNWPSIGDSTSRSILHLFQQLSDWHPIHLQWVPSHVGLLGNEVADDLAKASTNNPVDPEDHMVLISTEIYSRVKELICRTCLVPPVNPWSCKTPWIRHISQGFQIISNGILTIFDWSP
ncbi:uncharacterized protein TNCV_512881 [Trichonephila clavipes]|nr:uncharacterized protein TNCV_512881 [Trichonephila clavipes]